jgi:hypothetical protein
MTERAAVTVFNFDNGLNTYIVYDRERRAVIIDPFCFSRELFRYFENKKFILSAVLLSSPAEHAGAIAVMRKIYGNFPVYAPYAEEKLGFTAVDAVCSRHFGSLHMTIFPYSLGKNHNVLAFYTDFYFFAGSLLMNRLSLSFSERRRRQAFLDILEKRFAFGGQRLYILPSFGPPTTLQAEKQMGSDTAV